MGLQIIALALAAGLSAGGYGPFTIGMTFAQASAAAQGELKVDPIVPGSTCRYAVWKDAPGVRLMVDAGLLLRIDVLSGKVATDRGVRIGDPTTKIASAYGAANVRIEPDKDDPKTTNITVQPVLPEQKSLRIVFVAKGGRITQYRAGRLPQIAFTEGCS